MNPPLIQPSPICGFSVNSADAVAVERQPAEARRRTDGGHGRQTAVRRWKASSAARSTSDTPSP